MANLRTLAAWMALAVPCATMAPANGDAGRGDIDCGDGVSDVLNEPPDDGRGTPYHVKKGNNVCGLDEPRQISRPSKVDYQALLGVTSEVKEIKRRKIDPNSARGIELMSKARARVLTACETVRSNGSYCSVWKKISLRDPKKGTKPADITSDVKTEIAKKE
ncbi:MAG: hypothetical protein GY711_17360 [bacterium]|nr:hypothetical protein [bacterium]